MRDYGKVHTSYWTSATVRPLAFGLVGFFLRELAREHAASLIFLTKALVRGAIGSEAWNA